MLSIALSIKISRNGIKGIEIVELVLKLSWYAFFLEHFCHEPVDGDAAHRANVYASRKSFFVTHE